MSGEQYGYVLKVSGKYLHLDLSLMGYLSECLLGRESPRETELERERDDFRV